MENPENVNTDPSSENPNGLHKEDGELHQAVEAEGAATENRAKAAMKEDKKEVGDWKSWSCSYFSDEILASCVTCSCLMILL